MIIVFYMEHNSWFIFWWADAIVSHYAFQKHSWNSRTRYASALHNEAFKSEWCLCQKIELALKEPKISITIWFIPRQQHSQCYRMIKLRHWMKRNILCPFWILIFLFLHNLLYSDLANFWLDTFLTTHLIDDFGGKNHQNMS